MNTEPNTNVHLPKMQTLFYIKQEGGYEVFQGTKEDTSIRVCVFI